MAGDPYEELLGIPPDVRPVDYYTLLGLQRFCDEKEKVDAAVRKQLARLEPYRTGADPAQRAAAKALRDEIDQARSCLESPTARAAYERVLARQRSEAMGLVETPEAAEAPLAVAVTPLPRRTRRASLSALLVAGGVLLTVAAVAAIMAFRDKPPGPVGPTAENPPSPVAPAPQPGTSTSRSDTGGETRPADSQQVLTPVIRPAGGAIREPQKVYVSCKTPGVVIRYTTGEADPTSTWRTYVGFILVPPGTTLKVRAYRDDCRPSAVVEAVFTHSGAVAPTAPAAAQAARAAAEAWDKVKDFHPAQGFDAKLRAIVSCRFAADLARNRGDHAAAKGEYDKVVTLCRELQDLDSRRTSALSLRREAEAAVKRADNGRPPTPGSLVAQLRKASADAKAAFEAGRFDEAKSEWEKVRTLAQQVLAGERDPDPPVVRRVISEKQYAPWKRLCGAVAVIEKAVFAPRGDITTALVTCGSELEAACSALPADELNYHSKAVRRAAKGVLTSLEAYRKACEATQGKREFILANRKMRRNKLRSSIVAFVSDSMILAEVAKKKPSAKLAKLDTKLKPLREAQTRCGFCPSRGERACPTCRVKGRSTGKALCTRCRGTGNVACATCGGKGNIPCPSCRGFRPGRPPRPFGRGPSTACSTCNGTGLVHNKVGEISPGIGPCPGCKGEAGPPWTSPCPSCRGSGSRAAPCPRCNGTKKVPCTHCPAGKRRQ